MSVESTQRIEDEAGSWLLRRDSGDWSAQDDAAFDAWMQASMRHSVAYWRLESVWEKTGRLKALNTDPSTAEPPPPGQWNLSPFFGQRDKPRPARAWNGFKGLAAAAALVALFTASWVFWPGADKFTTPIGGLATMPMADGSKVTLNTDTVVGVTLSRDERRVVLERGEAFFEVAKDPRRPFSVSVGETRVVAVGTQFSVRRDRDDLKIIVTEGRIRIEAREGPGAAQSFGPGTFIRRTEGHWTVQEGRLQVAQDALSWRSGVLTFRDTPLAEAVAEFNRYNQRKIVLATAALSAMPIGGTFKTTNMESFVDILERAYPVRAELYRNRIEIVAER